MQRQRQLARGAAPLWLATGAGVIGLVLANGTFIYTTGLDWNHDLPVLLTLLAGRSKMRWCNMPRPTATTQRVRPTGSRSG